MESKLTEQEQQALRESQMVWELSEHKAWVEVFRPYLLDKLNQSFPDPTKITGINRDEQFLYEAKVAAIFKKVVAEILQFVEGHVQQAKFLERKEKGQETDPFQLGG